MAARKSAGTGEGAATGASASDNGAKRSSGAKRRRRPRGFGAGFDAGFGGGFGGGFGDFAGGGFGPGPFPMPPQFARMMSMLFALGGPAALSGMGGGNMHMTMQLMAWLLETWLDYLNAMQQVFHRAFERFQALDLGEGMMAALWDEDEEDDDSSW